MLGPFGKSGGKVFPVPERYHLAIVLADSIQDLTLFGLGQGYKICHSLAKGIFRALAYCQCIFAKTPVLIRINRYCVFFRSIPPEITR